MSLLRPSPRRHRRPPPPPSPIPRPIPPTPTYKKDGGEGEQGRQDGHEKDDDQDDVNDDFHVPFDLEERDPEGATPLHVALLHKKLGAARLLLEAGVGTSKRLEGSTPAHIALSVASIKRHRAFGGA